MPTIPLVSELVFPGAIELAGTSAVTTQELPGVGFLPDNLTSERNIQADQTTRFIFNWTVQGVLVNFMNPLCQFTVSLFYESWGNNELDVSLLTPPQNILYSAVVSSTPTSRTYQAILNVPPAVPVGLYDVVAVINFQDQTANPGPIAAFAEFGKIQYYRG